VKVNSSRSVTLTSGFVPDRSSGEPPAGSIDVAEVARDVGRGWRAVCGGLLLGLAVALALVLLVPPRYAATTTVLLRNASDPAGSLLSRVGLPGDLAGAVGGGALGNALKSPMETELQLLRSRDVLGQVVDSLGLQARVLAPRGVPSRALVVAAPHPGSFRRQTVTFSRGGDGRYSAGGATAVPPGGTINLPVVGRVTLAAGPLPPEFTLRFEDREDAITRLDDRLTVEKRGGELAELSYAGPDSLTAAEVPNAVAAVYLQRRRTVDRGLNARRYEFLVAQIDSAQRLLGPAEDALRREQEATGVFDPELAGRAGEEALNEVRKVLTPLEAQSAAVAQTLARAERGEVSPRQLAAFPAFLTSPAINTILGQIATLETERTRLLERRTARDPEIVALTQSVADLERQLTPLARTYASALERQAVELRGASAQLAGSLRALPRDAVGNLRRQRDVRRLSQTLLGLQAQLLDVRLAAVAEGGQVRQVDAAVAPKKIRFPRPLPTFGIAGIVGLLGGVLWAAAGGAFGSRVRVPADAARVTGLPAMAFRAGTPLWLGAGANAGTVIVAPVGAASADAAAVARRLVRMARDRGRTVALVDLATARQEGRRPGAVAQSLDAAEGAGRLVVVPLASLDDPYAAVVLEPPRGVLFVGRERRTRRAELAAAVDLAARLGLPCLGVVVASGAAEVGDGTEDDHAAARGSGRAARDRSVEPPGVQSLGVPGATDGVAPETGLA
jgi:tyrosine-protein kinase Etk/Wzc